MWGVGGRYIADPMTGVRTRIEPAHQPAVVSAPAAPVASVAQVKPTDAPAAIGQQSDQPNGDAVKNT
jgi:hypothetical protein